MLSVDVQAIGWAVYLFDRHSCLWFSKIISGFQVRYHPGDLAQFLADFPVTEAMAGENFTCGFKAQDQFGNLVPTTSLNPEIKASYVTAQSWAFYDIRNREKRRSLVRTCLH